MGYLNPDNFAQFEDGTPADITSGEAGDVMIEIPKIGYRIAKSGTTLTVQITDLDDMGGFTYLAHTRTFEGDRDKLYVGAFLGSGESKLRSLAEAEPMGNKHLLDLRNYAQANGLGYDLLSFYPLTLIQCLYLIMYKNLNSQIALGAGYVGTPGLELEAKTTGATVSKGMNYGSSDQAQQMKFLGMEDLWGNMLQWIEGIMTKSTLVVYIATANFNNLGDGYTALGQISSSGLQGYMKTPTGTNETGFLISSGGGSSSTYFADESSRSANSAAIFGGDHYSIHTAGMFSLHLSYDSEGNFPDVCGRLMYL